MFRYVIVVLAIWGAIMIFRHLRRSAASRETRSGAAGDTLRCDHCGLFVPREEAVSDGDRHYCSEAHRDADRARGA